MAWKRSGGSSPLSSTAKVLVKKYLILRCACLSYTTGGHIALRGRAVRLIGLLQSPFIWASGDLPTPPAGSPSVSRAQSREPLISSLSHHPRSWPAAPVRRDVRRVVVRDDLGRRTDLRSRCCQLIDHVDCTRRPWSDFHLWPARAAIWRRERWSATSPALAPIRCPRSTPRPDCDRRHGQARSERCKCPDWRPVSG
jgi:hypothetical protein